MNTSIREHVLEEIECVSGEKTELINKTSWSTDFSEEEIQSLARYVRICKVKKGIEVCREGVTEPYMFLILEGEVNILKENLGHNKKVITSVGVGGIIGEMSLIDGDPRSASVMASKDTSLLVLTKDRFFCLMDEVPRLGLKLLFKIAKSMSQRLRKTNGLIADYLQ